MKTLNEETMSKIDNLDIESLPFKFLDILGNSDPNYQEIYLALEILKVYPNIYSCLANIVFSE